MGHPQVLLLAAGRSTALEINTYNPSRLGQVSPQWKIDIDSIGFIFCSLGEYRPGAFIRSRSGYTLIKDDFGRQRILASPLSGRQESA